MIKENINKIDYRLKQLFDSVLIQEKSNKSDFYFEINASSIFNIDNENKRVSIKVEISKPSLNESNVKWRYYTNTNLLSDKIERVSSIDKISEDIYTTILTKKMDKEYLKSIPLEENIVVESIDIEEKEKLEKKLEEILKRFEIEEILINESVYDENVSVRTIKFKKNLKPSDLYMLDINLKSIGIDKIKYIDDTIEIQIYE